MAANKRPRKKYSPKHYVRAIKESEPVLDAEAHRKRKKQEG